MSLSNNQDVSLNESGGINNNNDYSHAMRHAEDTTPAALLEQLIYVDTFMPDADPTTLDEQLTAELAAFADDSFIFPDEDKPKDHDGNGNGYDLGGLAKSSDHMTNQNSNKNNGNDNNNNNNNNNSNNSNNSNNNHVLNNLNFSEQLRNHDSLSNNNSENNNNNNSNDTNADVLSQSLVTILSSQGNFSNSIINSLSSSLLSGVPKVHVPAGVQSTLVSAGLTQIQIDALAALIAQHQLKSNHNGDIFNNNDLNGGFNASAVDVLSGYSDSSAANGGGLLNNFTQPASQQQQQQHVNQTNFQAQSPENLLSSIVNLLNSQTHNQAQQNTSLSSQGQVFAFQQK
ncbi:hypothetical protein PACTADRAFT_33181 [Pachysolen tannophilus NRRL Y-2460]|uniref:Uncharacterized protein n=1 Tax=Pachysolen tannophilus NRRL Y-2460 TaxID=669874 RepID=A0A1E4TW82_PACTA|nr:hypothetical protein PACTADRAFT_33181 [Pachysolen tannophilus NRRL Y-2460]